MGGHAVFAVAGVIALIASGLLLFNTGSGPFSIDVPVVIFAGAMLGGLSMFAASKVIQARHGPSAPAGRSSRARGHGARAARPGRPDLHPGRALAGPSDEGAATPEVGDKVRVDSVEGLTLHVSPAPAQEQSLDREESPVWP